MTKSCLGIGLSYTLENQTSVPEGRVAAQRLKSCLIRQFGFKNKNITLLLDVKDPNVGTTRNILWKFKKMISKSKSGDTLLMFYIGHGGT